jgi:hypothetical protein
MLNSTAKWFAGELDQQLVEAGKRLKGGSHLKAIFSLSRLENQFSSLNRQAKFSIREWKGNFERSVYGLLLRVFRIRFQKEPSPTRTQRVRGYRDKGSESSVSERARRKANTVEWNHYLEEVYQYCLITGCHPRQALKLFNMRA